VGIGAIKYADLANDRIKDYIFDWNRMLSFDGNTAPYLMYAHARTRSVLGKAGAPDGGAGVIGVAAPQERALALELLQFPITIERTGESLQPHRLAGFLYQTATAFTSFWEHCPVLKADEPVRGSRLALSHLTALTLARGLSALGITPLEQM
jgi:arginyl-tRNA synthetase